MEVELTFRFASAADAADFLETANTTPARTSAHTVRKTAEASADEPPWNDAGPSDESDPWADQRKPAQTRSAPARSKPASALFPADGEYVVDTPNGKRTWTFGVAGAPECDCGHPAAMVTGRKAGAKRDWNAYWCPLGFDKSTYKDKCSFSEFV